MCIHMYWKDTNAHLVTLVYYNPLHQQKFSVLVLTFLLWNCLKLTFDFLGLKCTYVSIYIHNCTFYKRNHQIAFKKISETLF